MRALVTGAAGFIGSHLAAALLDAGHRVTGIDPLTASYSPILKRANLSGLCTRSSFKWVDADLAEAPLDSIVDGHDVIFHLAAIAGVRASWGDGFAAYVRNNILATQRLLESARRTSRPRVVYAGSSSAYGNADVYPCHETVTPRPLSPYGVSKLAGEQLCRAYDEAFGLHVVALRYFSVYGPRQRPDMGVHRIMEAARRGDRFTIFGDGSQIRDMTFVGDVVGSTLAAAAEDVPSGSIINIAGGAQVSLVQLIEMVSSISGQQIATTSITSQVGDVVRTGGDTSRARSLLGWEPRVDLEEGLTRQYDWHQQA